MVIGYLSWTSVLQILEDVSSHTALVNHQGLVIGDNEENHAPLFAHFAPAAIQNQLRFGKSGAFILKKNENMKDVSSLVSLVLQSGYLSYQGSGWGLILENPSNVVFSSARTSSIQLVLLLMPFILLGAFALLWMVAHWVVRPIVAFTNTTCLIAEGDLDRQVEIRSHDEMGQLGVSFNAMTKKLRESYKNLEEKVRQRTQELSKANLDLQKEIEDRKRLENVVLQSEKMAAVGQLAGGVAHEINNPLGVILGFAQSLVKRISPGDPMEMPLKSIEREAMRCKNLVQDLLTFSRMNRTDKEKINLNEAIESSLSLVLAQAKVRMQRLSKN